MMVLINLQPGFHPLQNMTLANNILAVKMRKMRKGNGAWPTSRLVWMTNEAVMYEITEPVDEPLA